MDDIIGKKIIRSLKKTFEQSNPINFVDKWNTPILVIQGGKD